MASIEKAAGLAEKAYFDESNISLLESALQEQVAGGKYLGRANRGLLKLYSLYPSRSNLDNIVLVLIKALTALPSPDFLLALYLVPGPLQSKQPSIAALIELERTLQTAQFAAFWERAAAPEVRSVLDRVPGFDEAVRGFIVGALGRTYDRLEGSVAQAALHLAPGEVPAFAQRVGWSLDADGATLVLPVTADNSSRPKKDTVTSAGGGVDGGLGLKYSDMTQLVAQLARN